MNSVKRTALVTGASRGIGRAIALALAREKIDLAVTARSRENLESLRDEVKPLGISCTVHATDLAQASAVHDTLDYFGSRCGNIDILVNNAGIGSGIRPGPVAEFDDAYWDLTMRLNLTVPYLFSKGVLPGMIRREHGRIINIASVAGRIPLIHGAAYSTSKHGLIGLTRTTALEVAGNGITVNAICPGPVRTDASNERIQYDTTRLGKTFTEIESGITPRGSRLETAEIAPLAVYLASDAAACVTGQAWNVDGGLCMA